MIPTAICVLGLAIAAGLSAAQSSTISLFIPGADEQPLIASIVGSDATATTYAIQCAPGTDSDDCGFDGVFTLTEGPATAAYTLSDDEGGTLLFDASFDCSLAGTTSAVCVESFGGEEADSPGMSTETLSSTDFMFIPVEITTGALPSIDRSPKPFVPSATTTPPTAAITPATSQTPGNSPGSGVTWSGAAQTSSSKSSTNGAVASASTGRANWALGGAAALAIALFK